MTVSARTPPDAASRPASLPVRWLWVASAVTATAGVLHVFAAFDHAQISARAAIAFVLAAVTQFGIAGWLALAARWPHMARPVVLAVAIAATVTFVAAFVLVYTNYWVAGLLGHNATAGHGHGLAVVLGPSRLSGSRVVAGGAPDLLGWATVGLELVGLAALVALLPRAWRNRTIDVLLGLVSVTWLAWVAGLIG